MALPLAKKHNDDDDDGLVAGLAAVVVDDVDVAFDDWCDSTNR